eukprot:CCRYP_005878-RA/>CCRYP_005878-RA protein AED:0.22 eAED:0.52 QI:0/0/0/1/0/0/3/0/124
MGYYIIRLDPDTSKICTIIFPWGKYSYLRLPMGIAGSRDIFQAKNLSQIILASLDDHLDHLRLVLTRLRRWLEKFEICTDASSKQLGSVITQGIPLTFLQQKTVCDVTKAQCDQNCTTGHSGDT